MASSPRGGKMWNGRSGCKITFSHILICAVTSQRQLLFMGVKNGIVLETVNNFINIFSAYKLGLINRFPIKYSSYIYAEFSDTKNICWLI